MLILSDDRPQISDDKIDLINSYRALKPWQQKKATNLIKKYCNPKNFKGNKTKKEILGIGKTNRSKFSRCLKIRFILT